MSGPATRVGSLADLAVALARQWWPQVAAQAAACAVVATTITGALAVGSALERGLRTLAIERLGRIEGAVLGESFFTASLVERLAARAAGGGPRHVVPAIVMPVTVSAGRGGTAAATLLACDDPAALGYEPAPPPLAPEAVLVNGPLAATLGIATGDAVVLRLPRRSSVPADSPLGRRTGGSDGRRLAVAEVLPARGLGQFSLRPAQATGPLVVTSLATARRILRRDDAVNAAFAVGMPAGSDAADWLRNNLQPELADYGLALEPASADPPSLRLTASRLILPPAADRVAADVLGPRGGRPTLVMLANALTAPGGTTTGTGSVPYSTVLGIDATSLPVGDLVDDEGRPLPAPADDAIIVNRWLADDLAAQGRPVRIGDPLTLSFFEPETVHGEVVEATATLTVAGIAALRSAAVAREVVPEVEGVTDEDSITDWDPPFPFDASRVRSTPPHDEDDRYWKRYRATPKAFVSLATARRLAGSRFGSTTAWLVPTTDAAAAATIDALAAELAGRMQPETLGLTVAPLVADALEASRGSTPFGGLFIALSSFVVIAGLLLEWLLFGLLVAARRRDLGVLAAVGWPPRRLVRLLVTIGGLAAVGGVALGTLLGPAWARGLLFFLGRRWAAEVDPGAAAGFTAPTAAPGPLAAGAAAALAVSLVALASAARRAGRIPPLALLRGGERPPPAGAHGRRWWAALVSGFGLVGAAVAATLGRGGPPAAALGLFFAAGLAALTSLLAAAWLWLSAAPGELPVRTLFGLAGRSLGFARARAFSVAAIVATATFLVVAVSSFAQRMPADPTDPAGPTGGWTEIVSFGEATSLDPADAAARSALGLSATQEEVLSRCQVARLRSSAGDDAACTNLYATLEPTILGVGPGFVARGGFGFVAHAPLAPQADGEPPNPWRSLEPPRAPTAPIPAVLDQATAQWALGLGGVGSRFTRRTEAGEPVEFEIVGLLEPGILQGFVIVAERDFERIFPARSGYGMALVDAGRVPAEQRSDVGPALAAAWTDAGPTVTPAIRRLASLQAVQNTFLAGFQALGTLGLLLGTAGVAAVQAQGTLERLGQFSVLRAMGFTLPRLRLLLVLETLTMVGLGLAVGLGAACLAIVPALAGGEARLPLKWIGLAVAGSLGPPRVAATAAAARQVIPARPQAE